VKLSSLLAPMGALAMAAAPIAAQAAPAEPRAESGAAEAESLAGGIPVWALLLIVAIGVGAYLAFDDSDTPVSA